MTIVVTTYNLGEALARCVSGLLAQTYPKSLVQIIVADDGSCDESLTHVAALAHEYPSVLVLRREHRGYRLASLKNAGICRADGALIAFLDGDVIPPPEWLASHVEVLSSSLEDRVSIGSRRFIDASSVSADELRTRPELLHGLPDVPSVSNWMSSVDRRTQELIRLEGHPCPYHLFHGCNAIASRMSLVEAGCFDEAFDGHWGYEDTELAYRLWTNGAEFVWSPSTVAYHQENEVLTFEQRAADDVINFRLACARIPGFESFKSRLNDAKRVPWW